MSELLEQFYDAIELWEAKTNKDAFMLWVLISTHSGYLQFYKETQTDVTPPMFLSIIIENGFSDVVLVTGLVSAIDVELTHYALVYESARPKWEREIVILEGLLSNPEQLSISQDSLMKMIKMYKSYLEDPDDDSAERKLLVDTWREVTKPLLEFSNLYAAIKDHKPPPVL